MPYYEWLAGFSVEHPGTHVIEHPFTGANRKRRRELGLKGRGFAVSRLGQSRKMRR